jgi:hypothetical protein
MHRPERSPRYPAGWMKTGIRLYIFSNRNQPRPDFLAESFFSAAPVLKQAGILQIDPQANLPIPQKNT